MHKLTETIKNVNCSVQIKQRMGYNMCNELVGSFLIDRLNNSAEELLYTIHKTTCTVYSPKHCDMHLHICKSLYNCGWVSDYAYILNICSNVMKLLMCICAKAVAVRVTPLGCNKRAC